MCTTNIGMIKKKREYHIDTHPLLNNFEAKKSIRYHPTAKQYSFSKRCWIGPGGEMKLLPKTDGFTQMVSAFVSHEIGVGLKISDEELHNVNKHRASREWCDYISCKEAIEIYGSEKKNH